MNNEVRNEIRGRLTTAPRSQLIRALVAVLDTEARAQVDEVDQGKRDPSLGWFHDGLDTAVVVVGKELGVDVEAMT